MMFSIGGPGGFVMGGPPGASGSSACDDDFDEYVRNK